jgi:protein SCO1/2
VNRRLGAAAAFAALALVVAGCSSSGSGHDHPKPSDLVGQRQVGKYLGAGLIPAQPRPSFTLKDEAGKDFAFGTQTAGRPTLLFFGYTHCPDECPTTMADIQLALRSVPADVAKQTYVVFVTTDVKRDTGARLKQWLGGFAAGTRAKWIGLTGTQADIDAAQAAAHVPIAEDNGETHSAELLLYGPDDYARVAFLLGSNEQKQIAHDLPIVARESS